MQNGHTLVKSYIGIDLTQLTLATQGLWVTFTSQLNMMRESDSF